MPSAERFVLFFFIRPRYVSLSYLSAFFHNWIENTFFMAPIIILLSVLKSLQEICTCVLHLLWTLHLLHVIVTNFGCSIDYWMWQIQIVMRGSTRMRHSRSLLCWRPILMLLPFWVCFLLFVSSSNFLLLCLVIFFFVRWIQLFHICLLFVVLAGSRQETQLAARVILGIAVLE